MTFAATSVVLLVMHHYRRTLERANGELRKLEQMKDDLTHMIVHDMRSPLMTVSGSLDMLRQEFAGRSPSVLETWQIGMGAAQELVAMCNSLLDVSRIEAGKMPIHREPLDLVTVASNAVTSTKAQAEPGRVSIAVEGNPTRAAADPKLLRRVLVNLLTNAIKHTPDGGRITVRVGTAGDRVRIEVQDTGPGIPREYHERIFEKFGQVEGRREGRKYSTGLGLTFCKLAVEAHAGAIGVKSEPGKGSTFWFTLPDGPASLR